MNTADSHIIQEQIIAQAQAQVLGASLAGVARTSDLKKSSSYLHYQKDPYYGSFQCFPEWPVEADSLLILALSHPQTASEMDWWDSRPGGTPGNRRLMDIQREMKVWLSEALGIRSQSLFYRIESGGVFLKDAAALAGIGVIGANNLLLTPTFGPQVRLRAMFLFAEIEPTRPLDFDPCLHCERPCTSACPQDAFRNGTYQRVYCQIQMRIDESNTKPLPENSGTEHVRYCRACELACPVGR